MSVSDGVLAARVGRVYQDALVGIATTPLIAQMFTGCHGDDLLVSMGSDHSLCKHDLHGR